MKVGIRAAFAAVISLTAAAVAAQQTVSIPPASLANHGKLSRFKYVIKANGSLLVDGKSMPLNVRLTMTKADKYGKPGRDGLTPVATTMAITSMSGSAAGKSLASEMPKMAKIPKLPSIVTYYDRSGMIRKIKASGLPGRPGSSQTISLPSSRQIAAQMSSFAFPVGQIEMGVPIVQAMDIPTGEKKISFQVTYIPTEIVMAGREQTVKFMVTSDSSIDIGTLVKELAGNKSLASTSSPATEVARMLNQFSGVLYFKMTGDICVGLKSGEIIRQNISPYILLSMGMAGKTMDMEFELDLSGYRM